MKHHATNHGYQRREPDLFSQAVKPLVVTVPPPAPPAVPTVSAPVVVPRVCPTCHQRVARLNPHKMCAAKVKLLELLGRARMEGVLWVKVEEGRTIKVGDKQETAPYRARAHASRLVWFGLAEHGETRSGLYRITEAGLAFLTGAGSVPAVIWCKGGVVVERSPETVTLSDVKDVVLDAAYFRRYALEQKPDWRAAAGGGNAEVRRQNVEG